MVRDVAVLVQAADDVGGGLRVVLDYQLNRAGFAGGVLA